ncbi:hypothetical protein [Oceanobacillus damuensis]|uniref:hypothetical protein n=1 Tax=Oceanobacillus damuensis TaxID=937928 RepID=UPI00083746B1|nr:hypothetical protein [Oceanobacillus damuensis]
MTQEIIDELLEAITLLLDDLKDIQENSYHMDELISQLESRVNDVEGNIVGLEQNAQSLNDKLSQVLECVMSRAKEEITDYKVIS